MKPGEAEAFHFCGHTFTTGSCIHPLGLPRVDSRGFPVRPERWQAGGQHRPARERQGAPIHDDGDRERDPDGLPLPPGPADQGLRARPRRRYGFEAHPQGAWYRCCGGTVRKLWDCCAHTDRRINGDAALHGYCYAGRKVFCVTYYQTHVPC